MLSLRYASRCYVAFVVASLQPWPHVLLGFIRVILWKRHERRCNRARIVESGVSALQAVFTFDFICLVLPLHFSREMPRVQEFILAGMGGKTIGEGMKVVS